MTKRRHYTWDEVKAEMLAKMSPAQRADYERDLEKLKQEMKEEQENYKCKVCAKLGPDNGVCIDCC